MDSKFFAEILGADDNPKKDNKIGNASFPRRKYFGYQHDTYLSDQCWPSKRPCAPIQECFQIGSF